MTNNIIKITNIIKNKNLNNRFVIAIDGPCGGGKSTLASEMEKDLGYNIVHMDDFYLPFDKRSAYWTNEIASHMDYDRLINTVLKPYRNNMKTNYISYDCHSDKYLEEIFIDLNKALVLEGSYSLNPIIKDYIDLKIFVDVDSDTQKERLKKRNEKTVDLFLNMWIPFENKYFKEFDIKNLAEITLYV